VIILWEPSTKQFYPKCQSLRVLPSSQSAWSIAAPSCIGSCPASQQSIRNGHAEHQAVSGFSAERSCRVKATRTNRPCRRLVETAWFFIQSGTALLSIPSSTTKAVILPVPATIGGPFKVYHGHSVWRA
jgi:hypothetical protein